MPKRFGSHKKRLSLNGMGAFLAPEGMEVIDLDRLADTDDQPKHRAEKLDRS